MAQESEVYVPAYDVSKQMEYKKIAEQIDAHLRDKYEGQKVVIRSLSASEHQEPLDDIIERIKSTGTDRNEPEKQGRGYEKVNCDFFGTYHEVHKSSNMIEPAIRKFYEKPKENGKPPMKVDLVLIYEAEHVEKVPYEDKDHDMHDAYKFRNPDNKQAALKGIIKIKSDSDDKQKGQAEGSAQQGSGNAQPSPENPQGKAPQKGGQGEISNEELMKALEQASASEEHPE